MANNMTIRNVFKVLTQRRMSFKNCVSLWHLSNMLYLVLLYTHKLPQSSSLVGPVSYKKNPAASQYWVPAWHMSKSILQNISVNNACQETWLLVCRRQRHGYLCRRQGHLKLVKYFTHFWIFTIHNLCFSFIIFIWAYYEKVDLIGTKYAMEYRTLSIEFLNQLMELQSEFHIHRDTLKFQERDYIKIHSILFFRKVFNWREHSDHTMVRSWNVSVEVWGSHRKNMLQPICPGFANPPCYSQITPFMYKENPKKEKVNNGREIFLTATWLTI